MVPEARLEQTKTGLVPASVGWFVMNVRDARRFHKPGQGDSVPLTGYDEFEAETFDETAARHNASSPEETQDGGVAYARFAPAQETRYPAGFLPGD